LRASDVVLSVRQRRQPAAFEIWQVGERVASIDNPVRIAILRAVEEKPRTLGDLVKLTGKAKSTLSTLHVKPLLQLGLIAEAADPADARIKWYRLEARRLGASAVGQDQLRTAVLEYARKAGLMPLRTLLEVIDVAALAKGPPAYAAAVGARIGTHLSRVLAASGGATRAQELDAILQRENLGRVHWKNDRAHPQSATKAQEPFLKALVAAAMTPPAAPAGSHDTASASSPSPAPPGSQA